MSLINASIKFYRMCNSIPECENVTGLFLVREGNKLYMRGSLPFGTTTYTIQIIDDQNTIVYNQTNSSSVAFNRDTTTGIVSGRIYKMRTSVSCSGGIDSDWSPFIGETPLRYDIEFLSTGMFLGSFAIEFLERLSPFKATFRLDTNMVIDETWLLGRSYDTEIGIVNHSAANKIDVKYDTGSYATTSGSITSGNTYTFETSYNQGSNEITIKLNNVTILTTSWSNFNALSGVTTAFGNMIYTLKEIMGGNSWPTLYSNYALTEGSGYTLNYNGAIGAIRPSFDIGITAIGGTGVEGVDFNWIPNMSKTLSTAISDTWLEFDGVNDYLQARNVSDFNVGASTNMEIIVIYKSKSNSSQVELVSKTNAAVTSGYALSVYNNGTKLCFGNTFTKDTSGNLAGGVSSDFDNLSYPNEDGWNFVQLSWWTISGNLELTVNEYDPLNISAEDTNTSMANNSLSSSELFTVGATSYGSRFFNGNISYLYVNGESFDFNEGQGTTVTGSNGTILDIYGAKWVKQNPEESWLEFDGINDYVQAANSSVFDVTTGDFDMEVRFRTTDNSGTSRRLIDKRGQGNRETTGLPSYQLSINGNTFQNTYITNNNGQWIGGGESDFNLINYPNDGAWHTIQFLWENSTGTGTLILDGIQIETDTNIDLIGDSISTSRLFTIGGANTGAQYFQGDISYVRFGTEEFFMNKGSGTTITGSEGTVLNIYGATWGSN